MGLRYEKRLKAKIDKQQARIGELEGKNKILDSAWKVLSGVNCKWANLAKKYAPKKEVERQERNITEVVDFVKQIEAENKQLREQLTQMCRVFHMEDCVCKWCNIVKERAAKGMEKMGFEPVEPKKPYNADDQPLKSGRTFTDNRNLRRGER